MARDRDRWTTTEEQELLEAVAAVREGKSTWSGDPSDFWKFVGDRTGRSENAARAKYARMDLPTLVPSIVISSPSVDGIALVRTVHRVLSYHPEVVHGAPVGPRGFWARVLREMGWTGKITEQSVRGMYCTLTGYDRPWDATIPLSGPAPGTLAASPSEKRPSRTGDQPGDPLERIARALERLAAAWESQ